MSKLSKTERFFDVSDYGRPIAIAVAQRLKRTKITPVQVTYLFGICGLTAVFCIFKGFYAVAAVLLILKSIIDAIDGELSRAKNTPSYTGRYLDSIFDIILNFLFLMAICCVSNASFLWMLGAFACLQFQGTLYNYYYVILRNNTEGGDRTSQIFEIKTPTAFPNESQKMVNILFLIFTILYGVFDKTIQALDPQAYKVKTLPNWFMTAVSFYGLGFQLLLMAVMLTCGWMDIVIPFFICYSCLIFVFVGVRRILLSGN